MASRKKIETIFESFKIVVQGKVFWVRAKEACGWTPDFVEEDENESDSDVGRGSRNSILRGKGGEKIHSQTPNEDGCNVEQKRTQSDDPFNIYDILKKKKDSTKVGSSSDSNLKFPPGFTHLFVVEDKSNDMNVLGDEDENRPNYVQEEIIASSAKKKNTSNIWNEEIDKSVCSDHFKSNELLRSGGSILQVMEDMVKVGQTMGYNMEGCINNIEEIIKSQGVNEETKMETLELFNIKRCWGNFNFDYVYSPSVGNSGGILCVWDPRVFRKDNSTISDYFVMVRGEWIPNGKMILIISIYAPKELSEKKMLWDYLILVIGNWQGEVIIMGDFNEVRKQEERYGLMFNVHGADAFNLFISNAGLEEIHLDGFDEFVKNTWKDAHVTDHNAIGKFMKKLKFLKGKIREWTKLKRVNSNNHKAELKEQLAEIDILVDKGEGNSKILNNRSFIFKSLQDIDKLESMELAQKAKIKWGIKGDENTKYYHGTLNKQRSQLAIRGVLVDEIWTESPKLVKNEFFSHFQNGFDHPQSARIQIDMDFPIELRTTGGHGMQYYSRRNKKGGVGLWDCGTDKSPGPDGFTFGFYRRFWSVIENDVVETVNMFFQNATFPKGGNASFIALILKTNDANMVNDFRPITLIGSLHKIIAKILANRLVSVLGDIVSEVQSAFVANRQILDGPFILNELVHCFTKVCDPLSPLLFLLVMESLHLSVQRVVDAGLFRGITICHSLQLSHLFYADDAVFMGQWSESNINVIVKVLDCFYRASGLRINMNKSKLMGLSVDNDKVVQAAAKIGCASLKTLFWYLGTKVGGLISRIKSWDEIVSKFCSRLSKWKMKTLSIGGRMTLIKSILGSLPIYHMSIYKVPKVLHRLESIRCHFFNGTDPISKKPIWVKWNKLLAPKDKGGLGISSFYALNRALLFKWDIVLADSRDRWSWSLEGSGDFSVASVRRLEE
ncbi:RNA-directed DNA polymerase, eukaryota [Tanacetum coccineum]